MVCSLLVPLLTPLRRARCTAQQHALQLEHLLLQLRLPLLRARDDARLLCVLLLKRRPRTLSDCALSSFF